MFFDRFLVDDDLGKKIGKIRYHYFQNWHFLTLDGIFEIKMIKKICLGGFRFEIGALLKKLGCLVPKLTNLTQLTKILG